MRPSFQEMTSAELRVWVEANRGRVNKRDRHQHTPLFSAVRWQNDLSLVTWLLDDKGADVNGTSSEGGTPLHAARSCEIISALLDRGADPNVMTTLCGVELSALMFRVGNGDVDCMVRLLQDQRVRDNVAVQSRSLNLACMHNDERKARVIIQLLLQAGGIPICAVFTTRQPWTC